MGGPDRRTLRRAVCEEGLTREEKLDVERIEAELALGDVAGRDGDAVGFDRDRERRRPVGEAVLGLVVAVGIVRRGRGALRLGGVGEDV